MNKERIIAKVKEKISVRKEDIKEAWEVVSQQLNDYDDKAWMKKFKPKFDSAINKGKLESWDTVKAAKTFNSFQWGRKVKEEYLNNPIIVANVSTGVYIVIDGNHRLKEAYRNKKDKIWVLMIKLPWASGLEGMEVSDFT